VVLDLNYSADSPGKQYAQRCGAHYYGGLAFFTAQAEAQRQFWQRYLPPR
jgi:shikimate 5-dehydrogenase